MTGDPVLARSTFWTLRRAAFWFLYACGLRPGEVYNLTLDRVDLEKRRVRIASRAATDDMPPFTIKAEGQSSDAKERFVPMPEAAIPDITTAAKQAFRSGGFICLTPKRYEIVKQHWQACRQGAEWAKHGHRPWQNRDMMNNLLRDAKAYLRRTGVELAGSFSLTAFRKLFAQNLVEAGTPPRTLAKLLGHTNTRVTMQFYNRVTDANDKAAVAAMDRLFQTTERAKDAP